MEGGRKQESCARDRGAACQPTTSPWLAEAVILTLGRRCWAATSMERKGGCAKLLGSMECGTHVTRDRLTRENHPAAARRASASPGYLARQRSVSSWIGLYTLFSQVSGKWSRRYVVVGDPIEQVRDLHSSHAPVLTTSWLASAIRKPQAP